MGRLCPLFGCFPDFGKKFFGMDRLYPLIWVSVFSFGFNLGIYRWCPVVEIPVISVGIISV